MQYVRIVGLRIRAVIDAVGLRSSQLMNLTMITFKVLKSKSFKRLAIPVLVIGLLLVRTQSSLGVILTVDGEGKIVMSILGESTESGEIEVKKIVDKETYEEGKISLQKENANVYLNVSTKSSSQTMNVTDIKDNLVELEQRPQVEKMVLRLENGRFILDQGMVGAATINEIEIDSASAKIAIKTRTGSKFLFVSPRGAFSTLYKMRLIDGIKDEKLMELYEDDDAQVYYEVHGFKNLNIMNLYIFELPISAKVSAQTGDFKGVVAPGWLKFISIFL
jgi:hypothetical protein